MRKIAGLFCAALLTAGYACAADVPATSRVSQVTVYASSAFVTRSSTVALKAGDTRVVFSDIIPEFDENSLRVKGKGSAEVKILGAELKREYTQEQPAEKVQGLMDQIQAIEDQNAKLQNERQVLAEEKQYLDSVRLFADKKIPEDLVTKMPSPTDLEGTLTFLDTKLKANFSRGQEIDISQRESQKKLEALRRELQQISGPGQKVKRSIVVEVEVVKDGDLDMDVSYSVYGASWRAVYDARANFEKSEVELVSYGIVRQNTGENWDDVDMTLSTAQVAASGNMPELNSWFIRPYAPPQVMDESNARYVFSKQKSLAGRSETRSDELTLAALSPAAVAPTEAVDAYAQAEAKGVSVSYKLTRKVTVKSDGADHKLPVTSQMLPARFEYSAYPRLSSMAYLRSRVTNAKDLQLLGGRVNVFLDGDFVGTSTVESIAPGQEFDLYMGADENVKVKRELLEEKSDDVMLGGIPSPTKKVTYKYKLTVENYKAKASQVRLFEAIPVSENDRIKVKASQVSLEPKEKEWKNKKGVWLWDFQLAPKGKQEIFYTCAVECPRDMRVEGLD